LQVTEMNLNSFEKLVNFGFHEIPKLTIKV
jgi:hypothetical protein